MVGRGQSDNYASADHLEKRQALFQFPDPERSFGEPLLARIPWTGKERVLDAGCGNGVWIRALRDRLPPRSIFGLDLSIGMLADTRQAVDIPQLLIAGDIQRLPFPSRCFDVVLCLWMLYHVPDHQAALEECRRILRPGGRLLATANITIDEPPLSKVLSTALESATGESRERWLPVPSFNAENGAEILGRVFGPVEARPHVAAFAVPSAEPVLAAMRSVRGPIEIFVGQPIDWGRVESVARRLIEKIIARDGAFRTANGSVSFLATR